MRRRQPVSMYCVNYLTGNESVQTTAVLARPFGVTEGSSGSNYFTVVRSPSLYNMDGDDCLEHQIIKSTVCGFEL